MQTSALQCRGSLLTSMLVKAHSLQKEDDEQLGSVAARFIACCDVVLQNLPGTLRSIDVNGTSLVLL